MSKRTVIVSGGILEKEFVLPILQSEETEFIIGVDKGLQFLYENEIKPDYIVGDFAWDLEERKFISLEEQETGSIISGRISSA